MNDRTSKLLASRLGLGTWQMGHSAAKRNEETAALRAGIDAGVTVIDTAEMYASGGAEEVTGQAIAGQREGLYLVSKVLPSNASYDGTIAACQRSLSRLRTDYLDLYLLHWSSSYPLAETVEAFETLVDRGLIGAWGVSNFDRDEMEELLRLDAGPGCLANQVYYSLSERGVEYDLLPWQLQNGIATMAYCPLDQGTLAGQRQLQPIADKHAATTAQIALAWLMSQTHVLPIPKSANVSRTVENAEARAIALDEDDLNDLDKLFPPPTGTSHLKIV